MSRKLAPEANRILFVKNLKYVPHHRPLFPGSISWGFGLAYSYSTTVDVLLILSRSYNVTAEQLFDLFGKFGPIRQIRQGIANNSKGTAFVVYEDVHDAKQACDKLNGFNFQNRYLVVLYHQPEKMVRTKEDLSERQENLERLKQQHGIE
ncbi:Nucleotide-binding alpha-beta plait [Penicillium brevicompactum]|uniref:Nucleotide-binding alpha-beta plait n=1 Tax=Penicillium brevicompactum TaxID=5074 RepID=A0A9W9UJP7_PENBR|nr:Nucleotide-binding alpha-beta plait [Penicillium brevicompactum]